MIKKIISGILALVPLVVITCNAIVLQVPSDGLQEDIYVTWPTQVQWDESSFFELIQTINTYLWFAIWVVCMAVLVYWGFVLISGQWNPEKMKQANKLLMGALIGILISVFSYALIKLIINLFA